MVCAAASGSALDLLHLAFDPPDREESGAWLLSSSIRVTFDAAYTHHQSERMSTLPTQHCMAHRVLPLSQTVVATEMMTSTLARLRR